MALGEEAPVGARLSGAVVRGLSLATGEGLVMVPPDRGTLTVSAHPHLRRVEHAFVEVSGQYVAEQTRVDPAADLAPPPPAYFLLGAAAGVRFEVDGRAWSAGLAATNLTNARYRDYTSLLRYTADEVGRDVRVRVGVTF
ncbi:MAG: TonB-dependent receptor [Myxococcota bacterium]